jgi:hypothetical protein
VRWAKVRQLKPAIAVRGPHHRDVPLADVIDLVLALAEQNEQIARHVDAKLFPETTRPGYAQTEGKSVEDIRKQLIREATVQANSTDGVGIFSGFEKEFNAVQQLWIAGRQLALRPNPYSQTLSAQKRWKTLLASVLQYYWVRLETFPVLEANRLKFFKGRILTVVIVLVFVAFTLLQMVPSRVIERPQGLSSGQEVGTSAGSSIDNSPARTDKAKE